MSIATSLRARMSANPIIQQIINRHTFDPTDTICMTIDMNDRRMDFRRIMSESFCQAQSEGKWRRRVIERVDGEVTDRIMFEFEHEADADKLRDFLAARRW